MVVAVIAGMVGGPLLNTLQIDTFFAAQSA